MSDAGPGRSEDNNVSRALDILSAIGADNAPRRVSEVLAELDIRRSTGYPLIRALARSGLVERPEHGWIRLGARAREFFFAPFASHLPALAEQPVVSTGPAADRRPMTAMPRSALWNPTLIETVDTAHFARPAPWRIGFANASTANPWRVALLQSMRYAARVQRSRVTRFSVTDAGDDPDAQADDVRRLAEEGIDLLMVSAAIAEHDALERAISEVIEAGVPVVAVDRRPRRVDGVVTFVTASDANIGRVSAVWLAEYLRGTGRVWMLSGLRGASPAARRRTAALHAFSEFEDIHVEAQAHTDWQEAGGREAIERLLDRFGAPPDGVWCDSGLQGVGSIGAFLEHADRVPPHTGGDLNRMYKLALSNRVAFAAVDYPAAMGALAFKAALDVLSGAMVPRRIEADIQVVLPRGCETVSVKADEWAELHVRWNLPDDYVLSQGPSVRS